MDWYKNIFFIILSILLLDCGHNRSEYRFATGSPGTSYYQVGKNIAKIVYKDTRIILEVLPNPLDFERDTLTLGSIKNCELLLDNKVDFAISQNDVPIDISIMSERGLNSTGIRSVLPLYPEIFFIIYKDSLNPKSLRDLVAGRTVAMGPKDSGTAQLTKILFAGFGLDTTKYKPKYVSFENNVLSDSIDISCLVTCFNNYRIRKSLMRNGKLFSLGNPQLAGKGSAADGFCLKYPLAKPYIIPKNTFGNLPREPILTVAIDAVLLTREEMNNEVVYNVVKAILENKQLIENKLLSQLTERFDPLKLQFPLHLGAKQYLERNEPSFFERYAELLALIFSILIAIIGGVSTFARWNKQRQKNRIDSYYEKIMSVQKQIKNYDTKDECEKAIKKLRNLREDAFKHLIDEKLSADESFRIFITFINDTQAELQHRINELEYDKNVKHQ